MPTTTTSNPFYDIVAPYLSKPLRQAQNLYETGQLAPAYYPGETVAAFDPTRAQGINLGVQAGLGPQQQLSDAYTSGLLGIAQGTDPATQRLAQQAATATAGQFAGAGTLGSARHSLAANRAAADTIAGRQLSALGQIPAAQTAALQPSRTLAEAGKAFQDYQQGVIGADKARYDYNVGRPAAALGQYQQLLGYPNIASYAPTTVTESAPAQTTADRIAGYTDTLGNVSNLVSGAANLWDTVGGWFAEGGEVGQQPTQPGPRYQRAKMRKMGGR